jgi:predicted DNA-binding transcriptional regulator AlpA
MAYAGGQQNIIKDYMENGLLDTKSAAKYLSISSALLVKFRLVGGGPRYVKLGRAVRYSGAALSAWLHANERETTSDSGSGAGKAVGNAR